jgi:hypothetical protein
VEGYAYTLFLDTMRDPGQAELGTEHNCVKLSSGDCTSGWLSDAGMPNFWTTIITKHIRTVLIKDLGAEFMFSLHAQAACPGTWVLAW